MWSICFLHLDQRHRIFTANFWVLAFFIILFVVKKLEQSGQVFPVELGLVDKQHKPLTPRNGFVVFAMLMVAKSMELIKQDYHFLLALMLVDLS